MCDVAYWCHRVFLWHWSDSPLLCQRKKSESVNMGEKNKHQFKDDDWFKLPPPTLNSLPCNLFSASFCCHQGQPFSWPYKGLSLRLKSSSHKIWFEINSVTFTMQRQTHCQTHPDLRHCLNKFCIPLLISLLWVILKKLFFTFTSVYVVTCIKVNFELECWLKITIQNAF